MEDVSKTLETIARTDIFEVAKQAGNFVGNPFKIDFDKTSVLTCDDWKHKVGGIAQGCFLLAFYENDFGDEDVNECLLLRALKPCAIPSDNNVIASRIEYFKEQLKTAGVDRQMDQFTRFEFSCSGLECSILGTFYKNKQGVIEFGADVENFYSPHLYRVYKPSGEYLQYIVNIRETSDSQNPVPNFQIGHVRYSSSRKEDSIGKDEKVYINTTDILGKRTALFGMTRTGKSNTVKMLIEATEKLAAKASPVGQIIFDINGEYANKNLQDEIAIYEKYKNKVTRYSVLEKKGFKVMKVNFFGEPIAGLDLIREHFKNLGKQSDYVEDFMGINLEKPEDESDQAQMTTYYRKLAIYKCCLKQAGFAIPQKDATLLFQGAKELNQGNVTPTMKTPVTYDQAIDWFSQVWKNYETWDYLVNYKSKHNGREWADNDMKALLRFLTQYRSPGERNSVSSFIKLKPLVPYHSPATDIPFENEIRNLVRDGRIVIVDLSQGDPEIQEFYSEKICRAIFNSSMKNFIDAYPNNYIQFYFEEAHNLFPKKEDKEQNQIYNRIAKEGAKLNLGMIYATQEVSSISSNILKNTQNWFIAHLNNDDEVRELRKFYDFSDFADSLVKFSAASDKGFVRMKTYSNPFVVPIQVKLFK
ncbi:MAG: ATP-binding protein [Bacteroidetes bacterium]|nr:ATP-binding protein [Bacteroidota bacterium]